MFIIHQTSAKSIVDSRKGGFPLHQPSLFDIQDSGLITYNEMKHAADSYSSPPPPPPPYQNNRLNLEGLYLRFQMAY